jgi:hypothetical protein
MAGAFDEESFKIADHHKHFEDACLCLTHGPVESNEQTAVDFTDHNKFIYIIRNNACVFNN